MERNSPITKSLPRKNRLASSRDTYARLEKGIEDKHHPTISATEIPSVFSPKEAKYSSWEGAYFGSILLSGHNENNLAENLHEDRIQISRRQFFINVADVSHRSLS